MVHSEESHDQRLRVAHVVQNMDIGGLEKLVSELITRSDATRFKTELICLGNGGTLYEELRQRGYEAIAMNKGDGIDLVLMLKMARHLRRHRIDIVHCHNWNPLVYGGVGGRLARCRAVVYTAHGPEIPVARRRLILQRMPVADRLVAVSEHVRRSAISKGGFSPNDVTTILNGIDVDRFSVNEHRSRLRSEIDASQDTPVLGVVARLSPEKDHRTLFDAFREILAQYPSAVLVVVGDGDLGGDLRTQARALGIAGNVKFLGNRSDVPLILSALDIFVLSSREEGLGITLLEAMAAGLPVVATAAGGIPEVVLHEQTGLVVPVGDAAAFAQGVLWMLANPEAAARMGEFGRQRAQSEFSIEEMVRKYESAYVEIVGARKAA